MIQSSVATAAPTDTQRSLGASRSGATRYRTARATVMTTTISTHRAAWIRNVTMPLVPRKPRTIGSTATRLTTIRKKTIAPTVSARAMSALLDEAAGLLLVVGEVDRGHQVAHAAGGAEQRDAGWRSPRRSRPCRCRRPVPIWSVMVFLMSLGDRRTERVELAGDRRRVGEEAVEQHRGDDRREDGEEGVVRHPGRHQRDVVGLRLGPAALGDLEPALGWDLLRLVGLFPGDPVGLGGLCGLACGSSCVVGLLPWRLPTLTA